MSKLKVGLLVAAVLVVAALAGGLVGAGAAIALIKTAYNGPTESLAVTEIVVHSEALGESVRLGVRLPDEYASEPDRDFPILLVLDGQSQGMPIFDAMRILSIVGVAEPAIIVEVPSSSAGRAQDFTPPRDLMTTAGGRADRFLHFIETEAIPAIESQLPVDSTRILVGHSLGGLFVLYALAQTPGLFDGHFAFSPSTWVGDGAIVPVLERSLNQTSFPETSVYLSLGELERNRMLDGFEATLTTLRSTAPNGLTWHADIVPGADHGDTPARSFPLAARRFLSK